MQFLCGHVPCGLLVASANHAMFMIVPVLDCETVACQLSGGGNYIIDTPGSYVVKNNVVQPSQGTIKAVPSRPLCCISGQNCCRHTLHFSSQRRPQLYVLRLCLPHITVFFVQEHL